MATMTKAQERKAFREIERATMTLPQVLRSYAGLYKTKLESCDGMTVEDFMAHMGVVRDPKKGYSPANIFAAWNENMFDEVTNEKGKVQKRAKVFRNVKGYYVPGDNKKIGEYELTSDRYDVYDSAEKAEKAGSRAYTRVTFRQISDNAWSVGKIHTGLLQSRHYADEEEKYLESELAWGELEHVYIRVEVKQADGTVKRVAVEIPKSDVKF